MRSLTQNRCDPREIRNAEMFLLWHIRQCWGWGKAEGGSSRLDAAGLYHAGNRLAGFQQKKLAETILLLHSKNHECIPNFSWLITCFSSKTLIWDLHSHTPWVKHICKLQPLMWSSTADQRYTLFPFSLLHKIIWFFGWGNRGKLEHRTMVTCAVKSILSTNTKTTTLWMDFSLALLCPFMTPCLMVIYFQASGDNDENRIELGGHFA